MDDKFITEQAKRLHYTLIELTKCKEELTQANSTIKELKKVIRDS